MADAPKIDNNSGYFERFRLKKLTGSNASAGWLEEDVMAQPRPVEAPFISERLTRGEISERYRYEWVSLVEVDKCNDGFVRSARVVSHSRTRQEALDRARLVWAREAVTLESDVIQMTSAEVDSHLDLQLLLSSRDEANPAAAAAQRVRAPIGSPAWRARLARMLNPAGPTEPLAETAALVHRGWLLHVLIEEPSPVYPTDAAGQAAYKSYLAAAQARFVAEIKAGGADILNPLVRSGSGADAMKGLVFGAARAKRYSWDDKDDLTVDKATLQQPPGPGEGKDLMERAVIAASFLCRLADTPQTGARQRCPAGQPCVSEPLLQPTGQRIAFFGIDARTRLLSIIDDAAPGVPDVNAMYEPSALVPLFFNIPGNVVNEAFINDAVRAVKRTRPAMDQQLRNWQLGPVLFEIYSRLSR